MEIFRVLVILSVCCVVLADYRQEALEIHNKYRSIHNAPRMRLSRRLNEGAQQWARELFDKFGGNGGHEHSPRSSRPGVGENIRWRCIYGFSQPGVEADTVQGALKYWYDEVCQYNFNYHGYQRGLGHFSQMVWKASTELGIGKVTGRENGNICTYIVARYKDVGNVDNREYFRRNVERGNFRDSYCGSVWGDEYLDAPEASTDE